MRMTIRSESRPPGSLSLTALAFVPACVPVLVLVFVAAIGCGGDRELTRMQGEVNRAATELVIQDAEARREWIEMQKSLDADRRQLASELRRDPIIAQAILQIGGIALCLLPLWLVARLLTRSERAVVLEPIDEAVLDQWIGQNVPLLPGGDHGQAIDAGPNLPPDIKPSPTEPSGLKLEHRDLNSLIDDRLSRRH